MSPHRPIQTTTDLLLTLWRGRMTIAITTFVAAVVTALLSLVLPPSFTAEATLMITESRLATTTPVTTHFNPRLYFTFVAMIQRDEVLQRIIDGHPLLVEREYEVEDLDHAVEVELISNSRLIEIRATLFDPALSAYVANVLAIEAQRYTQEFLQADEAATIRARLEPSLVSAEETYRRAVEDFERAAEVGTQESLEFEVETIGSALAEIRADRAPRAAQLAAQRQDSAQEVPLEARIQSLESEIAAFREGAQVEGRREILHALWQRRTGLLREQAAVETELADPGHAGSTREALQSQAATIAEMLQRAEASAEQTERELAAAELQDTRLTSLHRQLLKEREELYSRSTPTLEALVRGYDEQIAALEEELRRVHALAGEAKSGQNAAETRMEIAGNALRIIQSAYAEANLRLEEKHQGLLIVDQASVPNYRAFPQRKLLTILAAGFGFLLACAWVVIRQNALATLESPERS